MMEQLYTDFKAAGLEIVAVNVDQELDDARRFLASNPPPFQISRDHSGNCPQAFGVQAMPSSFIIDKTGRVRWTHSGFRRGDEQRIRRVIQSLIDDS